MEKKGFERVAHWFYRYWWVLWILAAVTIALYYAALRIFSVDFSPLNGDFQTYNVLRRTLAGQFPYRDFTNYLGMGVLAVNLPLLLFHNTFAGSLFVTNFVTMALFALMGLLLLYLVSGNKWVAAVGSLGLTLAARLLKTSGLLTEEWWATVILTEPGNSMRSVRMFWPFLLVLLYFFVAKWWRRRKGEAFALRVEMARARVCFGIGALLGFGFVWSNDFGAACIGSGLVVVAALAIAAHRKKAGRWLACIGAYLGGVVLFGLISITLVSGGHPLAFIGDTVGVSQYQFWYFFSTKIFGVKDLLNVEHFWPLVFWTVGCGFYCFWRLFRGKLTDWDLLYGFLCLSVFGAVLVYLYGNGRNDLVDVARFFLFVSVAGLLARGVLWLLGRKISPEWLKRALALLTACVLVLYTGLFAYKDVHAARAYRAEDFPARDVYLPELGGVTKYAPVLRHMQELTGGQPVFCTYSGALDTMEGRFQPTGTDYIIHALGNEQRAHYNEVFLAGEYPFVQTLNPVGVNWEVWAVRGNWDFYRHLFRGYQFMGPVGEWALWRRTGESAALPGAEVEVSVLDDATVEITLRGGSDEPCVASVALSYRVEYTKSPLLQGLWHKALWVQDDFMGEDDGYFLPAEAESHLVPVYMENGEGRIVLSARPAGGTTLTLESAVVDEVLPTQGYGAFIPAADFTG